MAKQGQVIPPGADDDTNDVPFSSEALAVLNRSEIEQQIEIARKYPRDAEKFRQKLEKYATINEAVALSMFYTLERRKADGTKTSIIGPSVRFAETLLPCWGNARAAVRVLGDQGSVASAQGVFFDCETNTGVAVEAQRSILDKNGNRFRNDMIVTTGNAAASIAYRNAILRGVPRALWLDIYEKAKLVAVGKAETFASQVKKAVDEFGKMGVTEVMILNAIGATSLREISHDNILALRVIFRELKDGEKTIEDIFGSPEDSEINNLMAQLGMNTTQQRMSIEAYKGRRAEHLEFLREKVRKAGLDVTPSATESKAEPEGDTTTTPTTTEAGTAEASTSQESKPKAEAKEAPKAAGKFDW